MSQPRNTAGKSYFGNALVLTFLLWGSAQPAYSATLSVLPGGDVSLRDPSTYPTVTRASGAGGSISVGNPGNISITAPTLIAPVSDGSGSLFHPTQSINLGLLPGAVFNFSTITIDPSVTVGFDRNGSNAPIYFLATGDIRIDGVLNGGSGPLYLSTPGTITLNGNLSGQEITLISGQPFLQNTPGTITLSGNQPLQIFNSQLNPGTGDIQLVSVPLPASGALLLWGLGTLWLPRLSRRVRSTVTAAFGYFKMPSWRYACR